MIGHLCTAPFDKAIALDPKYVRAFFNRADLFEKKKEWQHAVDDWHAAIGNIPFSDKLNVEAQTRLAKAEAMLASQVPKPRPLTGLPASRLAGSHL